jgi:hypothetical protein
MNKSPTVVQKQNEVICELCFSDIDTPELTKKISLGSCCLHLLCPGCLAEHEYDYPQDREGWRPQCTICSRSDQPMDLQYPSVKSRNSALFEDTPPPSSIRPTDAGNSTKLSAVLQNIENNIRGTKRFYTSPPFFNVVQY